MAAKITLDMPYQWKHRDYQEPLWNYLSGGGKRAVCRWSRRSGKDEVFLHHTACSMIERPGNYWYMLPEYSQARKSMWDAINPHSGKRRMDEVFPKQARTSYLENEMKLGMANSTFQLVGSDNFNSLVGSPPVGLVFSEYALSNPNSWGYLRPILLENGGWAGFNSTPRGNNHFRALCDLAEREPGWFYQKLTVNDTRQFTEDQLDSELRELQAEHGEAYGRAMYLQEYFCSFDAAIPGSIWGDCIEAAQREERIVDFDVDPAKPVYTAWDLGRTDDTAIWFYQFNGGRIDVFDYFASPFMDIYNEKQPEKGLVQMLRARAAAGGYKFERHWLPHDARPRTLAAGGKSILQQFHDAAEKHKDLGSFAIVKRLDRQEGIQAARATFPHARFHATNCEKGIEALKDYHREWDDEKKMFSDNPVHNWASHGADAWRSLALSWKRPKASNSEKPHLEDLLKKDFTTQTLGQIRDLHFKRQKQRREALFT